MTNHKIEKLIYLKEVLVKLEKDTKLFNKFNLFETLKITNTEIRHSNVLGWLMDPYENHGMNGEFLKLVIEDIYDIGDYRYAINKLEYDSFEIRREWQNIDLLAISKKDKFLLIIENKIWSDESEHQLEDYRRKINREFSDYKMMHVFLSPFGTESSNPDLWLTYDYERILNHIMNIMELHNKSLEIDVKLFIIHYIENLRRNIVGDSRLEELCLNIYNEHREAFDLILNNLPDERTIYRDIINGYLNNRDDIVLDASGKTLIRFITKNFDEVLPRSNAGWTKSGRIFLFEIENFDRFIKLKSVVGPSLGDERNILLKYMDISENKSLFKDINLDKQLVNKSNINRKYSHVNSVMILDKTSQDIRKINTIKEIIYSRLDKLFLTYIHDVEEYLIQIDQF